MNFHLVQFVFVQPPHGQDKTGEVLARNDSNTSMQSRPMPVHTRPNQNMYSTLSSSIRKGPVPCVTSTSQSTTTTGMGVCSSWFTLLSSMLAAFASSLERLVFALSLLRFAYTKAVTTLAGFFWISSSNNRTSNKTSLFWLEVAFVTVLLSSCDTSKS